VSRLRGASLFLLGATCETGHRTHLLSVSEELHGRSLHWLKSAKPEAVAFPISCTAGAMFRGAKSTGRSRGRGALKRGRDDVACVEATSGSSASHTESGEVVVGGCHVKVTRQGHALRLMIDLPNVYGTTEQTEIIQLPNVFATTEQTETTASPEGEPTASEAFQPFCYKNHFADCINAPETILSPVSCRDVDNWGRTSILWKGGYEGKPYSNLFNATQDNFVKRLYTNLAAGQMAYGQILDYMRFAGAAKSNQLVEDTGEKNFMNPDDPYFKNPFKEDQRVFH
jgi:hypothetical protein